ncbi:MAG: hypothetical protein P8013_14940 [Candidatus Sulfobium sp.]
MKGLSLFIGLSLMIASYGCVVEHRENGYREHHEYREHEEYRERGHERYYRDNGGRDEHRDEIEDHHDRD